MIQVSSVFHLNLNLKSINKFCRMFKHTKISHSNGRTVRPEINGNRPFARKVTGV